MKFPGKYIHLIWICAWINAAFSTGEQTSFEAAFQGQCEDAETPCEQICHNHSPRTFECSCKEGYLLDHNGYTCQLNPGPVNLVTDINGSGVQSDSSAAVLSYQRVGSPCAGVLCVAGGICAIDKVHGYRCLCPLGRTGKHCQERMTFRQPRFNGDAYAVLPLPTDWDYQFDLQMKLRADTENGLIFYSGEDLATVRNFVAVELVEGYVVFRIKLNDQKVGMQSRYKVPLGDDVMLHVGRKKSTLYVQVAGEERIVTTIQEFADEKLKATENIYLGGLPDLDNLPSGVLGSQLGFVGCVLSLEINGVSYSLEPLPFGAVLRGVNLDRCSTDACESLRCLNDGECVLDGPRKPKCDCVIPYVGNHCEIDLDREMPLFNGTSYLIYEMINSSLSDTTDFLVTFKPDDIEHGILLHVGRYKKESAFSDALQLRLQNGHVELAADLGEGYSILRSNQVVEAGIWYQIIVTRSGRYFEMILEGHGQTEILYNGAFSQLTLPRNILYIGGIDYTDVDDLQPSFRGCIDLYKTEFMGVKLKLSKALAGVNLDTCRST